MKTITKPNEQLVSVESGQEQLGDLGKTKFYELMSSGELESVKLGRRRLVLQSSIDLYIESLRSA